MQLQKRIRQHYLLLVDGEEGWAWAAVSSVTSGTVSELPQGPAMSGHGLSAGDPTSANPHGDSGTRFLPMKRGALAPLTNFGRAASKQTWYISTYLGRNDNQPSRATRVRARTTYLTPCLSLLYVVCVELSLFLFDRCIEFCACSTILSFLLPSSIHPHFWSPSGAQSSSHEYQFLFLIDRQSIT